MANDKHYIFGDNEYESNENIEHLKNWLDARQTLYELDETLRTSSTNKKDQIGMKLHMINAHQFSIDDVRWANEEPHDAIPRIKHKMSMMQNDSHYPELDHEDILAWHEHEHTSGNFADDYPYEDTGEEHRHL